MDAQQGSEAALTTAFEHALDYLKGLDETPVRAKLDLAALRDRFVRPLPAKGQPACDVIDQMVRDVPAGLNDCAGGRFFAWVIGGGLPAGLAADWLTSVWDQNAGMFSVAPAAAVVEEAFGVWLLELLGLPAHASFALVTGCQMAHVTCLAAARNRVLQQHDWDVEEQGLCGAPSIRILTGDQRHGTIERALRLLGLGRQCLVDIAVGDDGKLPVAALREQLEKDPTAPTIILLQAGDINTGSFDDFTQLIPLAHEYHAWVHVDGAFGSWVKASPEYRDLAEGIELADSWATDGHKWLNVPYDCGYAIVADPDAHRRSFAHIASYLNHSQTARDQVDWNPEYSRRARGFASYAALASLGREGIADLVTRCCRYAHQLVTEAGTIPGVEVLCVPVINQGLLRFLDPKAEATSDDHDRRTEHVTQRIVDSGEAFFACTTWRGIRCMRVSVCNWRTDEQAVQRAVAAIRAAAEYAED